MTKDVLITISGAHEAAELEFQSDSADGRDNIEVISRASYYKKGDTHYVFYDEPVEGSTQIIKNKIQYKDGKLEIIKTGLTNSHLTFENEKINVSNYDTPYGQLIVGTHTRLLTVDETEEEILISVDYELDINGAKMADSEINIKIKAVKESE